MADRDAAGKLRVYHTIYRLNLSFANMNQRLTSLLETVESNDHARFGKVSQAWEKEISDPDDVFICADERRRELAKQRRNRRPSKAGK